jgi:hypothetical protein
MRSPQTFTSSWSVREDTAAAHAGPPLYNRDAFVRDTIAVIEQLIPDYPVRLV